MAKIAGRALLALVAVLSLWGALASLSAPTEPTAPVAPMARDAELYRAVAARVQAGESYYHAAATEQRARDYPLKPFVTVRPPLLAEATAIAGSPASMGIALQLLVLMTLVAMIVRLRALGLSRPESLAAIGLAALAMLVIAQPDLALWHEAWAATLIALALALHRPERWWPSVLIALAAACVRELAIPFLLVMGFWAIIEKRRAEALAWFGALVVAAAALVLHALAVAQIVTAADQTSPGWSGAGGWLFVAPMLAKTSAFALLPGWLGAALVPVAFLGWAMVPHPAARRATLWIGGMMAAFALFGRPDNFYWGLMLAPLLPIGLSFTPRAVQRLARGTASRHACAHAGQTHPPDRRRRDRGI